MKTFYNKLLAVFETAENKAKFTSQEISPVQYIDIYAGQDQFEENFELFAQPAVLVDWDVDHKSESPIATVTLYCCYEQLRDTSNISENREKGLKFLDYISTIDEVARTIESETTGKLVLQTEGFNKMDSIVDIYLFTYECSYSGKKNPLVYEEGNYETMNLQTNLICSVFED